MRSRTYRLPTLSALTLVATGCSSTDPLVGDWVGTRSVTHYVLADGSEDVVDLPLPYVYEGTGVSTSYGFRLSLAADLSGELVRYYNIYRADGDVLDDRPYSATAEVVTRGTWRIAVAAQPALDLTCTASEELASCASEPVDAGGGIQADLTLDFRRVDES